MRNRLILTNDEGIFLSHAARIAEGEVLYRDLFGLTGPASYWLLAVVFKIAGISIASAHLILAAQIAILTSIVYYVTREWSDSATGLIGAFVFLVLNAADPAMMTNNHRWDADTYAICGIVAIWKGRSFLGGALLAMAVWATPILAVTAVAATFSAILLKQSPWRVMAGGTAGGLAGIAALALNGSLGAFIENLLWARTNYSGVNRMGYGTVVGGYPALFEGSSGALEWALRAFIIFGLTIPVWLPFLCGALLIRNHDRHRLYFFICGVSMIVAVSPRFDVGHFVFAVPLFYPLAASFIPTARWAVVPSWRPYTAVSLQRDYAARRYSFNQHARGTSENGPRFREDRAMAYGEYQTRRAYVRVSLSTHSLHAHPRQKCVQVLRSPTRPLH